MMSEKWPVKGIGEVLTIIRNGLNCKQNKSGDGTPISRIETISNAEINYEKVGYSEISEEHKEKFRLGKGDILFSHINSPIHVGKTALVTSDQELIHGINLLLFRTSDEVLPAYLNYYLIYIFKSGYWLQNCKQSVNQASVNQTDIKKVTLPIPTLQEQQRIVEILDVAFELIENWSSQIKQKSHNAKEIFHSAATNIFSQKGIDWEEKTLGEICEILDKLRKPITKKDRVFGEYPYYGASGIVDYVDGYIFDEKLILIGEDGAKWGSGENTAFAVEGKCWVNNHAHVIRPNRSIVLDNWLIYYLNITDLTEHITGLTVPKLNQGNLRGIQIPIAPLNQQQDAVEKLDLLFQNVALLIETYRSETESLIELKQSILQRAFSGKLTGGITA